MFSLARQSQFFALGREMAIVAGVFDANRAGKKKQMSQRQRYAPQLAQWIEQHCPDQVRIEEERLRKLIRQCGYTLDDRGYVMSRGRKMVWYSGAPYRDVVSFFPQPIVDGRVSYHPACLFANPEEEGKGQGTTQRLIAAAGLGIVDVALPEPTVTLADGRLAFRSEAMEIANSVIAVWQALLDELTQG